MIGVPVKAYGNVKGGEDYAVDVKAATFVDVHGVGAFEWRGELFTELLKLLVKASKGGADVASTPSGHGQETDVPQAVGSLNEGNIVLELAVSLVVVALDEAVGESSFAVFFKDLLKRLDLEGQTFPGPGRRR